MAASYWKETERLGRVSRKVAHRCYLPPPLSRTLYTRSASINVNRYSITLNTIRSILGTRNSFHPYGLPAIFGANEIRTSLRELRCECPGSLPLKIPSDQVVPFTYKEDSLMAYPSVIPVLCGRA